MLEALKLKILLSDEEFDKVYPLAIKKLSPRHFTSVKVSEKIVEWLNEYETHLKVIDLGCGVGKFCFALSCFTKHKISGVDYRASYIEICNRIKLKYGFKNIEFIYKNIMDLDFKEYNVFYFFNSFLELIDSTAKLDNEDKGSPMLYSIYETILKKKLFEMPKGTIVITYHVFSDQVPNNYDVVKMACDGELKMWLRR